MRTIYYSTNRYRRTAHGRRTPKGRPLCEVCADVYADAKRSVDRRILDATRAGVEDAITTYTKGTPTS